MQHPVENIRLSQQAKDQLIKLKRHTGIMNWNVLCRWAFCLSLAEKSVPPPQKIPADSNVEMTWQVFGGPIAEILHALLLQRCKEDGVDLEPGAVARHFRIHLHRGIGYLAGDPRIRSVSDLFFLGERPLPERRESAHSV